jgi:thymidylate synthase (FAD)
MPHVPELIPKKHAFANKLGQLPLTKFKDYRSSIKVKLIKHDDPVQMLKGTYKFVKATWAESSDENDNASGEQMNDALHQMLSGKALGLGLETVNLMFEISGITHIDAQQITRQRVGVTFSAQCTGDRFLTHNDILVEESINQSGSLLKGFIDSTLATKKSYSEMVDSLKVSIQAARSILPRNIETFYYMNTNLTTLLFFHQKRIDDGSQTWQMNDISKQMADEVCRVFPSLVSVFERNKSKFKFQKEASADRKNSFSTGLYIPRDDEFDYHDRDFLYPLKKNDMHFTGTPIPDTHYWGVCPISKIQYDTIKILYSSLDRENHEGDYTNEEILSRANKVNNLIETNVLSEVQRANLSMGRK